MSSNKFIHFFKKKEKKIMTLKDCYSYVLTNFFFQGGAVQFIGPFNYTHALNLIQ